MAWTATDLTNIDNDIMALVIGRRTVSVSIGTKTITYSQAQLGELRAFRAEIVAEIGESSGRPSFILTQTSK